MSRSCKKTSVSVSTSSVSTEKDVRIEPNAVTVVRASTLTVCDAEISEIAPFNLSLEDKILGCNGEYSSPVQQDGVVKHPDTYGASKRKGQSGDFFSSKRGRNGNPGSPETERDRYWACPFPKHNPERYEEVYNSCTNRPGFKELKRVNEHLHKVHSPEHCCETCRKRFYDAQPLVKHQSSNNCKERGESLKDPEWMTPEQERVFDKRFDVGTPEPERWRGMYQHLWPDDPNGAIISPYYDYCLEKHKLHKAEPEQDQRGKYPEPSPILNQKGILPFGTADITNLMSPPDIQIRRDSSFHDSDYQSLVEECTIDPSLLTALV